MSEGSSVVTVPAPADDGNEALSESSGDASLADAPSSSAANDAAREQGRNPSFHPGARIAEKYVVERLIGEGGLGVVVAAKHINLDQNVAIKYLRPAALGTKGVVERFLREARLAAKIRSEHIVHVYDVGTLPDGAPYIVMECLSGTDLGRLLSTSGPLPVDRAVDYVLQACEGLAEAHVAGVVHRDIKPGNLFLATSFGGTSVLKVLDFGISKMSAKRSASGEGGELTEVGDKFGTPVYMSPEQLLASGNVDARTDVWAIGVVLYELLTGALPFEGESLPELCTAILHRPPTPLLLARPDLPMQLWMVIERCLDKGVDKRFQNVAELAQELRPFVGPAGRERIEQVVRVILGAGDEVRPSTPSPSMYNADPRSRALTLAELVDKSMPTTGSGVASWGTMTGAGRRRPRLLVGVGAGVVVAALGIVALTGARSSAVPAAEQAALPAVSSEAPPQSMNADSPPPVAPPVADPPLPAVDVAPPPSPLVAPQQQVSRRGPRHVPPPKPVPSGQSSAKDAEKLSHADPNAVINPFE